MHALQTQTRTQRSWPAIAVAFAAAIMALAAVSGWGDAAAQQASDQPAPAAAAPPHAAPAAAPSAVVPDAPAATAAPSAASAPTSPAAPAPSVAAAALPRDLSPWGMFVSADVVVKVVMIGLLFASLVTWTIWLAKTIEIASARRRVRSALRMLQESRTLADAERRFEGRNDAAAQLVRVAMAETRLSANTSGEGLKERAAWLLERCQAAGSRRIGRGVGALASIGATAPFVGLFGTVWGIMNSFIGISNAHTTNLAVVAPGIAEALLATALGLFAAIPAVVFYNLFARSIGTYRALLADAAALVMRLVSRDGERAAMPLSRAAE